MKVIHMPKSFTPPNAQTVSAILGLDDDPGGDGDGVEIAAGMLNGETEFTRAELERIAKALRTTVDILCETDERFNRYLPPDTNARREIALKLMNTGHNAEYAAEICGIDIAVVNRLLNR